MNTDFLDFQAAVAGRYSIEQELGRGGMGIVFLAREVALDRMVALKLLPPGMAAQPGVKERFLREARTAARLSHPNIVQIHAVDEADGFVYFAMAYVDGGTLGDRIRERGPLSNTDAVRLLREVSWALGHAHLQGVVHRDVKPDNILLDADSGRALVTDFGIAVVGEEGDAAAPDAADTVLGTAEFMSPEQASGGTVDARSDLYSLACVGFYALSGRVPFQAADASEVLVKHLTEPAPSVLSVAPHAPPPVAAALDRCLRKDPEKRFAAGEELAEALSSSRDEERGELPVALRVFVKQSREWETTVAWSGFGLLLIIPVVIGMIATGASVGIWWLAAIIVALLGLPVASLVRAARRLMSSGYTRDDGLLALERDVERKEEEFRFQVGERRTWTDRLVRGLKWTGFLGAPVGLALGYFTGSSVLFQLGSAGIPLGFASVLTQEVRARVRGDVMGERLLKFWESRVGRLLFRMGGVKLDRVAPAVAGVHRPTEVVIGLEADRLFEELPKETRRELEGLPATVRALEEDAQSLRRQVSEMEAVLAEIGDDDPSLPSSDERARLRESVRATRDQAKEKLREAVAALETVRLGLLRMHAGSGTVDGLTMELEAARGISRDMENLLDGHREVERVLRERRETGAFTLPLARATGG